jgi:hypothetical protein
MCDRIVLNVYYVISTEVLDVLYGIYSTVCTKSHAIIMDHDQPINRQSGFLFASTSTFLTFARC